MPAADAEDVDQAVRAAHRALSDSAWAGLTATQLEGLRKDFLLRRPNAAGTARVHILTGNAYERNGQLARAVESYERGLAVDPLDLSLLQRYRAVRRSLGQRAPT